MLEIHSLFEKANDEYTFDIELNIGKITCAKSCFLESLSKENMTIDGSYDSIDLNQTMTLEYIDGKYIVVVNGPDGGIYFSKETDLTVKEFDELVTWFKTVYCLNPFN